MVNTFPGTFSLTFLFSNLKFRICTESSDLFMIKRLLKRLDLYYRVAGERGTVVVKRKKIGPTVDTPASLQPKDLECLAGGLCWFKLSHRYHV